MDNLTLIIIILIIILIYLSFSCYEDFASTSKRNKSNKIINNNSPKPAPKSYDKKDSLIKLSPKRKSVSKMIKNSPKEAAKKAPKEAPKDNVEKTNEIKPIKKLSERRRSISKMVKNSPKEAAKEAPIKSITMPSPVSSKAKINIPTKKTYKSSSSKKPQKEVLDRYYSNRRQSVSSKREKDIDINLLSKSNNFIKLNRDKDNNIYNINSNLELDGDFDILGKFNVAGKDMNSIIDSKISPYILTTLVNEKIKNFAPVQDYVLPEYFDSKLNAYVKSSDLNTTMLKYSLKDNNNLITSGDLMKKISDGFKLQKNKSLCIGNNCLTYEDMQYIKSGFQPKVVTPEVKKKEIVEVSAPQSTPIIINTAKIPQSMIIKIEVKDLTNNTIYLPFVFEDANDKITVNWDDGNIKNYDITIDNTEADNTYNSVGKVFNTYKAVGNYTIQINGKIKRLGKFMKKDEIEKSGMNLIKSVTNWGDLDLETLPYAFLGATNLVEVPNYLPATVYAIPGMFADATSFNGDISKWDVSNVSNIGTLFKGATSFNQPIGNWDVSNVSSFDSTFQDATSFNQPLDDWNISSAESVDAMFAGATSFNQPLNSWSDKLAGISSLRFMFKNAKAFNGDISEWDVSTIRNMTGMFDGATSFNSDISSWNVSNVTRMFLMFNNATSFEIDISGWNVAKVTDVSSQNDFSQGSPILGTNYLPTKFAELG